MTDDIGMSENTVFSADQPTTRLTMTLPNNGLRISVTSKRRKQQGVSLSLLDECGDLVCSPYRRPRVVYIYNQFIGIELMV